MRKLGPEAKRLADLYFFETLVRVHRAGEGAPYTGLKPAGQHLGRAIPAADKAIADGSVQPVVKILNETVTSGLQKRFDRVMQARSYRKDDVDAARSYVKAYVEFIHYVEAVDAAGMGRTERADELRGKSVEADKEGGE